MLLLADEQMGEAIGREWDTDVSNHPLPDRVKRMCNVVAKAQLKKVLDYLWDYSTACSAPNPWEIIGITLTKEQWQSLLDEVKE